MKKQFFKNLYLFLVVGFTFLFLSPAAIAGEKLIDPSGKVTITVPKTWVEVPREYTQKHIRLVRKLTGMQYYRYDFAYQPRSTKEWLSKAPYVILTIQKNQRMSKYELSKMAQYSVDVTKKMNQNTGYKTVVKGLKMNEPIYNRESNTVWVKAKGYVRNSGQVDVIGAMKLTNKGFVMISCYIPTTELHDVMPQCTSMIDSVKIPESMRYE